MKTKNLLPFHLAIPVNDLEKSKNFYKNILGCEEGRSSNHWVDFNFFGHQLVIHFKEKESDNTLKLTQLMVRMFPFLILGLYLNGMIFKIFQKN